MPYRINVAPMTMDSIPASPIAIWRTQMATWKILDATKVEGKVEASPRSAWGSSRSVRIEDVAPSEGHTPGRKAHFDLTHPACRSLR